MSCDEQGFMICSIYFSSWVLLIKSLLDLEILIYIYFLLFKYIVSIYRVIIIQARIRYVSKRRKLRFIFNWKRYRHRIRYRVLIYSDSVDLFVKLLEVLLWAKT